MLRHLLQPLTQRLEKTIHLKEKELKVDDSEWDTEMCSDAHF